MAALSAKVGSAVFSWLDMPVGISYNAYMNGMQRKKLKREHSKRFDADGLPRDQNDWLEEDWKDLHDAMEWVKKRVAERHKHERKKA